MFVPSALARVRYCPAEMLLPPNTMTGCEVALVVGVEVVPPMPISVPPVTANVFSSQSKPPSGTVVPLAMTTPPLMVSVALESMPSLLVPMANT